MPSSETLEEKSRILDLLEIYGGLLTERQRSLIQQHYAEDLSYGEIAEQLRISRQAVHDSIGHGKRSLGRFESHLHLASRVSDGVGATPEIDSPASGESSGDRVDIENVRHLVAKARRLVGDDLMYDTADLKTVLASLASAVGPPSA